MRTAFVMKALQRRYYRQIDLNGEQVVVFDSAIRRERGLASHTSKGNGNYQWYRDLNYAIVKSDHPKTENAEASAPFTTPKGRKYTLYTGDADRLNGTFETDDGLHLEPVVDQKRACIIRSCRIRTEMKQNAVGLFPTAFHFYDFFSALSRAAQHLQEARRGSTGSGKRFESLVLLDCLHFCGSVCFVEAPCASTVSCPSLQRRQCL
ncbi:hypothetical protein PO124_30190 [Bacillus licheniformis]|nr:hypothetical protein [Bacillus licheniformis]